MLFTAAYGNNRAHHEDMRIRDEQHREEMEVLRTLTEEIHARVHQDMGG